MFWCQGIVFCCLVFVLSKGSDQSRETRAATRPEKSNAVLSAVWTVQLLGEVFLWMFKSFFPGVKLMALTAEVSFICFDFRPGRLISNPTRNINMPILSSKNLNTSF